MAFDYPPVASFAGSVRLAAVTPGSAAPSPGAITLSASFAGWLKSFFYQSTWLPLDHAGR
jgi:hypothetical protein